jgi:hypothetical protein
MHHTLPATKELLLTEYVDTMRGGDASVPVSIAKLPPSASAEEDEVEIMEE